MATLIKIERQRVGTILDFKEVSKHSIRDIMQFLTEFPTRSCDFSIGGIAIWANYFNYKYCIFNDTLFIRGSDESGYFFHRPIGSRPLRESIAILREYCNESGKELRIIIPEEIEPEILDEFNASHPSNLPTWMEYIYSISQFENFKGKKMEKKRNHLNYFLNNYPDFEVVEINQSSSRELTEFNDSFNLYHKEDPTFEYESNAMAEALMEYDSFPYFGVMIKRHGEILGYTFGEAIGDTFFIHAEKGNIEYRGIYQILSSELSKRIRHEFPNVIYLNREDDMGNEYLRQSKMSYHPVKFVAKYMFE